MAEHLRWLFTRDGWSRQPLGSKRVTKNKILVLKAVQRVGMWKYRERKVDRWVFHIKWSHKPDGLLEVWKDGKLVVRKTGPNTYNDERVPFLKWGLQTTLEV